MNSISKLYLLARCLCTPLEAMYTLLIFILVQEMNPSALQLAILGGAKPVSSLISFYCTAGIIGKPHLYTRYLTALNLLTALPTLLFPWVNSCWYYVAAYLIFIVGQRASFPAWNSCLRSHLTLAEMGHMQGYSIAVQQSLLIVCPVLIGFWLDLDKSIWKGLFASLALVQIFYGLFLSRLPCSKEKAPPSEKQNPLFIKQWQDSWRLLYERRDFLRYLNMFFWGGAGLVMMQSVLPVFLKTNLQLSYTTITLTFSACKGLALLASTRLWVQGFQQVSIYRLNAYINLLSTLFIAFVLLSNSCVAALFLAYILYGGMQAGCELSWNLSGPLFAKERECSLFASLNLPFVGLRGLIFPLLGQWILFQGGANLVFFTAMCMTAAATCYAEVLSRKPVPHEAIEAG